MGSYIIRLKKLLFESSINLALPKLPHFALKLVMEGGWLLLGQIASLVGTFLFVSVTAKLVSPIEYGSFALCLSICGLINQTISGGAASGIGRYYAVSIETKKQREYFTASLVLLTACSLLVTIVLAISIQIFHQYSTELSLRALIVLIVHALLSAWISAIGGIQNAARMRATVAFHQIIETWSKIGFVLLIVPYCTNKVEGVAFAYLSSAILTSISQTFFFYLRIDSIGLSFSRESIEWLGKMANFSWPFVVWGVPTWILQSSDRWAIELNCTTEQVGYYSIAYQIGFVSISAAGGLVAAVITPVLYSHAGLANNSKVNNEIVRLSLAISVTGILLAILLSLSSFIWSNLLIQLLAPRGYAVAADYIPWMLLAGGMFVSGQTLAVAYISLMKTRRLLAVKLISSSIGVAMNVVGAYFFGVEGVLLGLVLFSATYCFLSILFIENGFHQLLNIVMRPQLLFSELKKRE